MNGPTVVLLHAFPLDARMWAYQVQVLTEAGWNVLVPDLPGFGAAPLLAGEPNLDAVAGALLEVLDERGIDRAVIGGISLGGYVAMALLRKRPEIFAAVICCDTKATADGDIARENRLKLAKAVTDSPAECGPILRAALLTGLLGQTTHEQRPAVVEQVSNWLDDADPLSVAWYQRAMAARPDSLAALGALQVPALVLWGEQDTLSPQPDQDAMLQVLRRGQEVRIAGAGHLSIVEQPAESSRAIADFIEGVRASFY